MRTRCLAILALMGLAVALQAETGLELATSREKDLKFDDLFPRRPFTGKSARVFGWSPDDRYVAFSWNAYDDPGYDLWVYDTKSGKSERISTPQTFKPFDYDIDEALTQYDEDQKRLKEWEKLDDQQYREEQRKFEEERRKNRTPRKSYPGISDLNWAKKSNEFLMIYRGDIYRWKLGDKTPTRLTDTQDNESRPEYLADDSGFFYQRGSSVYRMRFNSPAIVQITPELKDGQSLSGYSVSPDGKRMMLNAYKAASGTGRQVDYISYRDRFARAMKTNRDVADDDFRGENYLYLVDIREEVINDKSKKNEPLEVWNWKGGEEWQQTSVSDHPWNDDSTKFVFATWKRDKREFKVEVADIVNRKVDEIYTGTTEGEQNTPGLANPMFAKDGLTVYALLDKSGWRHLHALDGKGGERQITMGEFEVYPIQLAADGKSILVNSSKEDLARNDIYRVNPETGVMDRLTKQDGNYNSPSFAHKSDRFVATFNSWNQLRELFFVDRDEKAITSSHRSEEFWKIIKHKPELFTFKNRHGDDIHCFGFIPSDIKPGEKRPLFIYVYGGPLGTGHSVSDGSFGTTDYMFAQYLTDVLGYITVTIDPRGQSGYSARFGAANWENPGVAQTEDIVDLVKYFDAKGILDRERVGLNGWSFGGFQTQHTLYTAPEYVTLGIAGAGPTEWQNYNNWYSGGVIFNTPKGKVEDIDKFSLTHLAKNLQHPLLLLHGMEDTNVLFQDTVHVYQELLRAGKGPLVELALDPTGGHGMGGDMNTRDRHAIYLAFILKHWEKDRQARP